MRKIQKQNLLGIIKTLYEAHNIIKKYFAEGNTNNLQYMLSECQNTAIHIAEIIEGSEGENCPVIPYLETYCNEIYKIYNDFRDNAYEQLNRMMEKIENSIENDILIRLEVAFMPYKASMWDCMESIWSAANADASCDAYVVPIPYYDRNPDGSLGQIHYEGTEMPNYVPIVNYSSYSLEKRRPDIIYIHNPYDEYNRVTTVEPYFYCKELKKYTDMLVYVPYFFTGGEFPESHLGLPAYNYIDKIVVQGERAANDLIPYVGKDKVLAIGSPKCDKQIAQKGIGIPNEWIKLANGRKVIMFNTSIAGFLADVNKFFKKFEYVCNYFVNREDVLLLWRPHPLLKTTIKSMYPKLLHLYENMERMFINNKLGIYDTNPNNNMAISFSDAYIGEISSMIHLFGVLGKPILILDNAIYELPNDDDIKRSLKLGRLSPSSSDDYYWSISTNNFVCKIYKDTGIIELFCKLHNIYDKFQYNVACEYDGNLYISPSKSNSICIINIATKEAKYIEVPNCSKFASPKFFNVYALKDCVYFLPYSYPGILKYDIKKEKISVVNNGFDAFKHNNPRFGNLFLGYNILQQNESIVMLTSTVNNTVMLFDMNTCKSKVYKIGNDENIFMMSVFDGTYYWMYTIEQNKLIRWNEITQEIKEYYIELSKVKYSFDKYSNSFPGFRCIWGGMINFDKYIYVLPCSADRGFKFDKETEKLYFDQGSNIYLSGNRKNSYFSEVSNCFGAIKINDEECVFLSGYDCSLINYNIHKGIVSNRSCRILSEKIDMLKEEDTFIHCDEYYPFASFEDQYWSLDDFVNLAVVSKYKYKEKQIAEYSKVINNSDGSCGQKIHNEITNLLEG